MSKERPIIFNDEMVRAILEGRKTQTRRIVKGVRYWGDEYDKQWRPHVIGPDRAGEFTWWEGPSHGQSCYHKARSPFGQPGDRLWVRECWQGPLFTGELPTDWRDSKYQSPEFCHYRASGDSCEFFDADDNWQQRWRPSIHMPRWASRITLEITGVRVERLQDMCVSDAWAEGIESGQITAHNGSVEAFAALWRSIYGADSWQSNPWVWVVEFRRVQP